MFFLIENKFVGIEFLVVFRVDDVQDHAAFFIKVQDNLFGIAFLVELDVDAGIGTVGLGFR